MSFRNRNKGLVLAMEEADTTVAPEVQMDPQLPAEVEQASQEVAEQATEIEELNTAVEEAEADAETLGEIQETLAETVDSGEGVDATTAEIAEIAVEAICARLGIRMTGSALPAMESFGSKSSRLTATRVAVESIGEKIKAIWEAIKKGFLLVWQKIKDFFAKFFNNSEKVKKMAEALKTKVEGKAKAKPKAGKIKFSGAGALNVDGKVDMTSLETILGNHDNMTAQQLASVDAIGKAVDVLDGMVKGAADDEAKGKLEKAAKAVLETVSKGGGASVAEVSGSFVSKVGPFVGGDTLEMAFTPAESKFTLQTVAASKPAPAEFEALAPNQALTACDLVIALMTKTNDFKKQQGKIEALNKSMVDLVNAALKVADKAADMGEKSAAVKEGLSVARKAVTSLNSFSSRLVTLTPAMNVRAGKAALNFVSASLASYEEEKAAA